MMSRIGVTCLACVVPLLSANCPPKQITVTKPPERFFVAFVKHGADNIEARFSPDAQNWQSGNFPASATSTSPPARTVVPYQGVGASSDSNGVIHNVLFDQPHAFTDVHGLGPATWDTTGRKQSLGANPASAPSTVDIGNDQRLVAIQEPGDRVGVHQYDRTVGRVVASIPLTGPLNASVSRRPAITRRDDGEILVAWTQNDTMITAAGRKHRSGYIIFDTPRQLVLSSTNVAGAAASAPAVANDDSHFYLAVVQEERGAPLHGWLVVIYRSTDGVTWSEFDRVLQHDVTNQSHLGLAGKSNGSLLVAAVTKGTSMATAAARVCTRSTPTAPCSWATVQPATMFPGGASYKEFALVRTGNE
jgi:hypothetical protein